MKYQCPHCNGDLTEDSIMFGSCPHCKKVIDFKTVKKVGDAAVLSRNDDMPLPKEPAKPSSTHIETTNAQFCKHCGTEIKEIARFCPSCGKSLTQSDEKTTHEEETDSKQGERMKCPYCFEEIPKGATRCKYCSGEIFWCPRCNKMVAVDTKPKFVGWIRGGTKDVKTCRECGRILQGPRF